MDQWTDAHEAARTDLIKAILDDPCLARYDYAKRPYLLTDFSKLGFGYDLCQPDSDHAPSLAAMEREMNGAECEFLLPKVDLRLRTTGFGSRRSRGRERCLHSHLGEAMALDWGIHKNRPKLWGIRFTGLTDCYALRFILTYDGPNPVILRIQMRFQLWAMDLYHRAGTSMITPDYWSRLEADMCFDELTRTYLNKTVGFKEHYSPVSGTMLAENMPGYREPRIRSNLPADDADGPTHSTNYVDTCVAPILSAIYTDDSNGHGLCLQTVPILRGFVTADESDLLSRRPLHQQNITAIASELISYSFAVFGFGSGHFLPLHHRTPINIAMAADIRPSGRAMFKKFADCPSISNSSDDFLQRLRSSKASDTIHAYLLHTPRFRVAASEKAFWTTQSALVRTLRSKRNLQVFWAFIHPSCDMALAKSFRRSTGRAGWLISSTDVYFPQFGDSLAEGSTVYVGVHRGCTANHDNIRIAFPPPTVPKPLASFLYTPFNNKTHAVSLARSHADFASTGCLASAPPPPATSMHQYREKRLYLLHRSGDNTHVAAGSGVYDTDGLCPPLCSPNTNIFGGNFGIEFQDDTTTYIRPIASYEIARCYRLHDDVTYALSHPGNHMLLDSAIPRRTSAAFLDVITQRLEAIRTENFEIHDPRLSHAPAAITMAPAFVNGSIGSRLPDPTVWKKALQNDPQTKILVDMVANPGLTSDKALMAKLHYVYRMPARKGNFAIRNGILYMKELFANDDRFVDLRIVPETLQNIIFVAFHANPIGGHLNAPRTFHRIRLRYFWPHMYKYIDRLITACPGCNLSNITQTKSSDLIYGFPIDAPMRVLFVDIYKAGSALNYSGTKHYLIAACGMTSFAICEDTKEETAQAFAAAIMKIWLRFGFSHTLVVDKGSAFFGEFAACARLLNVNIHVLSGENHDPMLVERICRFLNSSLEIFCGERGTNKAALEGILMALYAWNSAPVVGTDISRSLLVVGREFQFPIDFSADEHHILTSNSAKTHSYAASQADLLTYSRAVAQELIHHHRAYHREYVNSRRPNPRLYTVGDVVFARRAVKSIASRGLVGKLMNSFTGPWIITEKLAGSSYSLRHQISGKIGKRHAAHLSPYPRELLPFAPIDGADNRLGQIYTPIQADPYKNAGISGFKPVQPINFTLFNVDANSSHIHFPTLDELNAELYDWHPGEREAVFADDSLCQQLDIFASSVATSGPDPPTPAPATPVAPTAIDLMAQIYTSTDRLFFIAHTVPGSDVAEWTLVQVDLPLSMREHPACISDGRFLVNFYTCHPDDKFFNATNQRYWIEYHPKTMDADPHRQRTTHLIRPSPQSNHYASAEGLLPFRQWVRLTNSDTFIHGPFDWATVNNRKSRDRVSSAHWKALAPYSNIFSNPIPDLSLPTWSIHLCQPHSTYTSVEHESRICAYMSAPSGPNTV